MPELIIRSGKLSGRKLVLPDSEIVIGRDDDCQIRLTSADVSRRHCRILVTDEGLIARDLGSRNGTFVNEKTVVDAVTLRPGDKLRVGPMIFEVPAPEETIISKETEETTVAPTPKPSKGKPPQKKKKKKLYISLPSRDKIGVSDSSDDDIATWLSAGDEDEEVSTGDTTIIPRSSPVLEELAKRKKEIESQKKPAPKTTVPSLSPVAPISPARKVPTVSKHVSLEEEAAEIIRKHLQSVQQKENS